MLDATLNERCNVLLFNVTGREPHVAECIHNFLVRFVDLQLDFVLLCIGFGLPHLHSQLVILVYANLLVQFSLTEGRDMMCNLSLRQYNRFLPVGGILISLLQLYLHYC